MLLRAQCRFCALFLSQPVDAQASIGLQGPFLEVENRLETKPGPHDGVESSRENEFEKTLEKTLESSSDAALAPERPRTSRLDGESGGSVLSRPCDEATAAAVAVRASSASAEAQATGGGDADGTERGSTRDATAVAP
eukprot:6189869-Pleurochrysis_carterae.AAC.3